MHMLDNMPSWRRTHSEKTSSDELNRRRSIFGTLPKYSQSNLGQHVSASEEPSAPSETAPGHAISESVVSLPAPAPPEIIETVPSPMLEVPDVPARPQRFSLLKVRHASDSQLSRTARQHANAASYAPPHPPSIITTAPTLENLDVSRRRSVFMLHRRPKSPATGETKAYPNLSVRPSSAGAHVFFQEPQKLRTTPGSPAPPPYGEEGNSSLALPVPRVSDSSRSDGSSADHGIYATTTTTHTVSTTTTFFRLPRRKKDKGPLFPLPAKIQPTSVSTPGGTPSIVQGPDSPSRRSSVHPFDAASIHGSPRRSGQDSPSRSFQLPRGSASMLRTGSKASMRSVQSSTTLNRPRFGDNRGRSSTLGSPHRAQDEEYPKAPSLVQSTRTSVSTTGRPSLAGLFGSSRFRQASEPTVRTRVNSTTPGTPLSIDSNQNPFNVTPIVPPIVVPERQEGDTPARYLARLEEVVHRAALVAILSKSDDDFTRNVLRSYMRRFLFFEDPMDMAVRKMLMRVELPKETQQIDRTLQSFADRYHECNPGIFASSDEAYFIAFSILILHTDVFNKNNKHKMQKHEYLSNTRGQGVAPEVLECFYENIIYTPFIHVEDDMDFTAQRLSSGKLLRKGGLRSSSSSLRKSGGPVDPYTLIMDGNLESLRPSFEDLTMEDPFSYLGTGGPMNLTDLYQTFFKSGVIQILSSRSRPDAFSNQATISNPAGAQAGVVDMKVTKVGILWRKDPKKKKARSPWQEWGAILTGSQLYFFRNASWAKSLVSQYEAHQRTGRAGTPVTFHPPLEQFKPDFLLSTDGLVGLVDSEYKKHKNAILVSRPHMFFQEVVLADNEADMNDWLAKLNYAATFRTAGVRMRGVIGGSLEASQVSETGPDGHPSSSHTTELPPNEVSIRKRRLDSDLQRQVMEARRSIMAQKISGEEEKLVELEKQLEHYLRTARHLKILTPIQQRTREEVLTAVSRVSNNIRWTRVEKWRTQCYRDILVSDLREDLGLRNDGPSDRSPSRHTPPHSQTKENRGRLGFGRLSSKNASSPGQSNQRGSKGSSSLSGPRLFSMEEIFRSPSKVRANHKPKGSWELPQLAFDGSQSNSPTTTERPQSVDETPKASPFGLEANDMSDEQPNASGLAPSKRSMDRDEQEVLKEAGFFSPNPQMGDFEQGTMASNEGDPAKLTDTEASDGMNKIRHSLQRKLHGSSHSNHRSKIDSTSSVGTADDSSSIHDGEGLTRSTGSFTVQGRKASVVTFGAEWQKMSPEEKLRVHRSTHADSSKLSDTGSINEDAVVDFEEPRLKKPLLASNVNVVAMQNVPDLGISIDQPSDGEEFATPVSRHDPGLNASTLSFVYNLVVSEDPSSTTKDME